MLFPLLHEPGPCPACRAEDRWRALHVHDRPKRRVTQAARLAMLGCERCGLVISHPRPTEAELTAYYDTADGWQRRIEADADGEAGDTERKLAAKRDHYRRAYALLEPHLRVAGGDHTPRALDFGCGLGAWLDVLRDAGFETWGLEPGPLARDIAARRHRMVDQPPDEEVFDLVIVNHVAEHLGEPLSVMRSLAECIVAGGRLFVSVPDLGRLAEHTKFGYVSSDLHICSYTFASMRSLLGLAGFRVLAHLNTPEWDAVSESEPTHLRVIAEKTGDVAEPTGTPLEAAITSLLAYEPVAERLAADKRHRAGEAKAARIAAVAPAESSGKDDVPNVDAPGRLARVLRMVGKRVGT